MLICDKHFKCQLVMTIKSLFPFNTLYQSFCEMCIFILRITGFLPSCPRLRTETDPVSKTTCLELQMMDRVQKLGNSECYTPSSERFTFYAMDFPYDGVMAHRTLASGLLSSPSQLPSGKSVLLLSVMTCRVESSPSDALT
jgi:hypothetical protein